MTHSQTYTVDVELDPESGDHYLQFNDEILEATGWKVGDVLKWTQLDDEKWQLTLSSL